MPLPGSPVIHRWALCPLAPCTDIDQRGYYRAGGTSMFSIGASEADGSAKQEIPVAGRR